MHSRFISALASLTGLFLSYTASSAYSESTPPAPALAPLARFSPFTGKVTRNKVRLRLHPSLDSQVVSEFNRGDMLVIVGEQDEFFAMQPPPTVKGYVYRTFVIDNVIEGNRVNVRLSPDTDGAVVTQLNSGDYVEGALCPLNSKWYEITLPNSAHFWICKEYVEQIGPPNMMAQIERRRGEANDLLNETFLAAREEMLKPFPQINLQPICSGFNRLVNEYRDFPEQSGRAREIISQLQEEYLSKKVAFLESKAYATERLTAEVQGERNRVQQLEKELQEVKLRPLPEEKAFLAVTHEVAAPSPSTAAAASPSAVPEPSARMVAWQAKEEAVFLAWKGSDEQLTWDDFYTAQQSNAIDLQGVIEPYERTVKNKPGDYQLLTQTNHQPIAYLYSTTVNLSELVGHTVTVSVAPRPNNSFAFPAYVVLSVK